MTDLGGRIFSCEQREVARPDIRPSPAWDTLCSLFTTQGPALRPRAPSVGHGASASLTPACPVQGMLLTVPHSASLGTLGMSGTALGAPRASETISRVTGHGWGREETPEVGPWGPCRTSTPRGQLEFLPAKGTVTRQGSDPCLLISCFLCTFYLRPALDVQSQLQRLPVNPPPGAPLPSSVSRVRLSQQRSHDDMQ